MTNDSEYRAEAVYMANALISKMWTDNPNQLVTKYSSPGGVEYQDFRDNHVHTAFGTAMTTDPIVLVDDAVAAACAVEEQPRGAGVGVLAAARRPHRSQLHDDRCGRQELTDEP